MELLTISAPFFHIVDFSTYKLSGSGLASLAKLAPDGRIVIDLSLKKSLPDLPKDYAQDVYEDSVEKERTGKKGGDRWGGVPNLNVLLCIVGSRGQSSRAAAGLIDAPS